MYSTTNRSLYRHVVYCVPVSCKTNGAGNQLGAWRYSDLFAGVYAYRYKEIKICYDNAGYMTKMATMPLYGKNPSKTSLVSVI